MVEVEFQRIILSPGEAFAVASEILDRMGDEVMRTITDPHRSLAFAKHLQPREAERLTKYLVSLWEEMLAGRVRPEVVRGIMRDYLRSARFNTDAREGRAFLDSRMGIKTPEGVRLTDDVIEAAAEIQYRRFLHRLRDEKGRRRRKGLLETANPHHAVQVLSAAMHPESLVNAFLALFVYDLHQALTKVLSRPPLRPKKTGTLSVVVPASEAETTLTLVGDVLDERIARKAVVDLVVYAAENERKTLGLPPDTPEAEMVQAAERALVEGRELEVERRPLPYRAPGL